MHYYIVFGTSIDQLRFRIALETPHMHKAPLIFPFFAVFSVWQVIRIQSGMQNSQLWSGVRSWHDDGTATRLVKENVYSKELSHQWTVVTRYNPAHYVVIQGQNVSV